MLARCVGVASRGSRAAAARPSLAGAAWRPIRRSCFQSHNIRLSNVRGACTATAAAAAAAFVSTVSAEAALPVSPRMPPLGTFTSTQMTPAFARLFDEELLGSQATYFKERACNAFAKGQRVAVTWKVENGHLQFDFMDKNVKTHGEKVQEFFDSMAAHHPGWEEQLGQWTLCTGDSIKIPLPPVS